MKTFTEQEIREYLKLNYISDNIPENIFLDDFFNSKKQNKALYAKRINVGIEIDFSSIFNSCYKAVSLDGKLLKEEIYKVEFFENGHIIVNDEIPIKELYQILIS